MVDPKTKSLSDFLDKLNECAEGELGDEAKHMIDNLLNAELPTHLKLSLNLAYLRKWHIRSNCRTARKRI